MKKHRRETFQLVEEPTDYLNPHGHVCQLRGAFFFKIACSFESNTNPQLNTVVNVFRALATLLKHTK